MSYHESEQIQTVVKPLVQSIVRQAIKEMPDNIHDFIINVIKQDWSQQQKKQSQDINKNLDIINSVPELQRLTESKKRAIAYELEEIFLEAGEDAVNEYQKNDYLYIIQEGVVDLYTNFQTEEEEHLDEQSSGMVGLQEKVTVITNSDCSFLKFKKHLYL